MTPEELEKNNQGQHLLGRSFHKAAGLTGKIFMDRILLPTANRPNPLLIVSSKFISLANQCGLLNVDAVVLTWVILLVFFTRLRMIFTGVMILTMAVMCLAITRKPSWRLAKKQIARRRP